MLPRYDTPPYDRFSPHPEIECRRMSLLYRLLSCTGETPLTLAAPWSALRELALQWLALRWISPPPKALAWASPF